MLPVYKTKTLQESYVDEISDQFNDDSDVWDALEQFARGLISDQEMLDRMKWLRIQAERRAQQIIFNPESEGLDGLEWEHA